MAELSEIRKLLPEKIVSKIAEKEPFLKISPSSPIGIFDSGVGGLTVLKEVIKRLPHENIIYLADTLRVPYGERPAKEIIKINHEILNFLVKEGAKLIIMACGTSSAIAYPVIKDKYRLPIIELIEGGSHEAILSTKNGRIGLIATVACVESNAYQKKLKELKSDVEVFAVGCPLFVPLIEGGFIDNEETKKVAKEYLKPLLKANIDTLILGCTHYPHLQDVIKQIVGEDVVLIDPAKEAARKAEETLKKLNLLNEKDGKEKIKFFVTGSIEQFKEIGSKLFGKPIRFVRQVVL